MNSECRVELFRLAGVLAVAVNVLPCLGMVEGEFVRRVPNFITYRQVRNP